MPDKNRVIDPALTQDQETDAALIAACLRGEQSAYTQLYERFAAGIYRLCYGLVLNKQDAEDVVQEVFVYAFKNLPRYDATKAAFKTWLYTIALSRCRNTYRRKRPLHIDLAELFQWPISAPYSERPEAVMAQQDAQAALKKALVKLSPVLREAVILRYAHGLTYREMADVMNCPSKTAESRVRTAHEQLRRLLHPVGQGLLEELLSF